ncbi:MAG: PAS domain S-box protein, partial [Terriglobia bacterium]
IGRKLGLFIQRERAERALREGEERFRTLANSIPQLAWIAGADGSIDWYNDLWYEYTGTTAEQMRGRGWQAVHDPAVLPKVTERWKAAIAAGEPFGMEFPLLGADGRFRMFLTRVRPLRDKDGRVVQWFGTNTDVNELKQVEESLRASQVRLNSTLAAGSIGTWSWDTLSDQLTADEFTAAMFIIDPNAAAKGLPAEAWIQSIKEEDQARVRAEVARSIDSRAPFDFECRIPQKDGEIRWVQAKGRVEGNAAGPGLFFHGAVIDITQRRRIDARFRRLVDSNAQGVLFWNGTGISEANDAFLGIVGYTREDLDAGSINWAAMTPPGYENLDRRALKELGEGGICTPFEKEYFRKDGSRVPVLLGAAAFEDTRDEGVCFVLDITGHKQADQALQESEEHFRFLHELYEATRELHDPGQIMAVTAGMLGRQLRVSRCTYANVDPEGDAYTIPFDYTDGCPSMVGRYRLSMFGTRAYSTVRSGKPLILRNIQAELPAADGAEMYASMGIEAAVVCVLVKDGRLRATMAVHQTTPRDWKPDEIAIVQEVVERCWATIERRALEDSMRQLNAQLEQRVVERTADLEAANKELEAFSYSVSHDLRAPLRAVDGFSQAVLENYGALLPEQGLHYLETIRRGARQMGALIDDLLELARLGRQAVKRRTVDTDEMVRDVIADLSSQREGRQIEIRTGCLPPCQADAALLKQVWVNLLSNAFKYTRVREHAVVEIGCLREKNEDVYFVRDNGTGFDMRYADKLFGVFQRLHRADDFEGTGVGLAIVQRVIHRHGGNVWADAAVGHGATFSFTLKGKSS